MNVTESGLQPTKLLEKPEKLDAKAGGKRELAIQVEGTVILPEITLFLSPSKMLATQKSLPELKRWSSDTSPHQPKMKGLQSKMLALPKLRNCCIQ